MWRRTLQPQALNLVRVLPVDNAAWISARISTIPQLASSSRYWIELRDDVLILYPAFHLLNQHKSLLTSPPKDTTCYTLTPISEPSELERLPPDHILLLAEMVPTQHVVTFVLPTVRFTCRQNTHTICLRGPRVRAAAHITFNSSNAVSRWRDDFNGAMLRDRKRLSDFRVLRHVGKGASGRVYEIEDIVNCQRLALKVIEKTTVFESKDTYRHAMDERLVLQIIRHHPYILEMKYAFQNAKRLFLVTEYCSGGDLFEYMNRRVAPLDEKTARFISAQVLLALSHLHKLGIVYRDLKLENILIDDNGHIRLADFGLTKVLRQPDGTLARTNTFCGTREYVAPEMLRGDAYDTSLDFWTFGVLLYEMLSGRTPFYTSDHSEIYRRIEKSPIFYPRHLSSEVRSLLAKLLVRDPVKRLGATKGGIKSIYKHAWYKSIDWDSMMDRDSLDSPLKRTVTFQQRQHDNQKESKAAAAAAALRNSKKDDSIASHGSLNYSTTSHNTPTTTNRRRHRRNMNHPPMHITPIRRKSRKEVKQERAFANVLADVQADLRYASSCTNLENKNNDDSNNNNNNNSNNNNSLSIHNPLSNASFSGSILGLTRPRTPMGRSGDLVLAGYSFYDMQQRRAISESGGGPGPGTLSCRSSSAVFSSRGRWVVNCEEDDEEEPPPALSSEIDVDMDSRAFELYNKNKLLSTTYTTTTSKQVIIPRNASGNRSGGSRSAGSSSRSNKNHGTITTTNTTTSPSSSSSSSSQSRRTNKNKTENDSPLTSLSAPKACSRQRADLPTPLIHARKNNEGADDDDGLVVSRGQRAVPKVSEASLDDGAISSSSALAPFDLRSEPNLTIGLNLRDRCVDDLELHAPDDMGYDDDDVNTDIWTDGDGEPEVDEHVENDDDDNNNNNNVPLVVVHEDDDNDDDEFADIQNDNENDNDNDNGGDDKRNGWSILKINNKKSHSTKDVTKLVEQQKEIRKPLLQQMISVAGTAFKRTQSESPTCIRTPVNSMRKATTTTMVEGRFL